jgi:hypothetical protein
MSNQQGPGEKKQRQTKGVRLQNAERRIEELELTLDELWDLNLRSQVHEALSQVLESTLTGQTLYEAPITTVPDDHWIWLTTWEKHQYHEGAQRLRKAIEDAVWHQPLPQNNPKGDNQ